MQKILHLKDRNVKFKFNFHRKSERNVPRFSVEMALDLTVQVLFNGQRILFVLHSEHKIKKDIS